MEIFLMLVVLTMLIFLFRSISGLKEELHSLGEELHQIKQLSAKGSQEIVAKTGGVTKASTPEIQVVENAKPPEMEVPAKSLQADVPVFPEQRPVFETRETPAQIPEPQKFPPESMLRQSWFSRWLQDNPDIEKFVGENLVNKIGISVLVLGVAFFVKYAIDQEWINRIGRVCIGLLCGIVLTWLGNRLRKNYHAFSSVLVGGALAIFYFTIAFAFHQYHLLTQAAAFGIMVIITVFAVLLSILYNRIELGILATVGGFLAPFLVSQGDGNWLVLFSYLGILNAGLIVLAYHKRWRVLNFIAFLFTQIIYLGWVFSKEGSADFHYQSVFLFGLVFYLMFLGMNIVHHVVRGSALKAFDFLILLSANLCFYGAGMYLIDQSGVTRYNGLFTASLGVVNLALAYLFFRQSRADRKFVFLLIGITVSFISLAAPVQLKGHYITLFWASEIVVLLWLYQKSFIRLLKVSVLCVTGLMLISLIMDWAAIYGYYPTLYPILFNKGWVTGMFASTALFFVYRLMRKEADQYFLRGIPNRLIRNFYLIAAIILLFTTGALETGGQFGRRIPVDGLAGIYLQLYLTWFVTCLLFLLARFRLRIPVVLPVVLPLIVFGSYVLNISNEFDAEKTLLFSGKNKPWFAGVWLGAASLLFLCWLTIKYLRKNQTGFPRAAPHLVWIFALLAVTIVSVETGNLFIWVNFTDHSSFYTLATAFDKAGVTIVWAVSCFVMIWMGMKYSYKPLRITALVLFGITLVKLFLLDIRNIAPAGKIVAFILLGVLLLVISFMYQRLKKIIIQNAGDAA